MSVRISRIAALVALAWWIPSAASAQSRVTFTPSLSLASIYDDNIFLRSLGSGDSIMQLSPGIESGYQSPRVRLFGSYLFDMQRSFENPALDDPDARRHGFVEGHYQRTAKLSFALVGRYDFTETAGDLSFNTGVLLGRHKAVRWEVNPSFTYQMRPRTTLTVLYDKVTERIVGQTSAFEHIARATITRQRTPRTSFGFGYGMRHFINGPETHTSNAVLFGSTYAFTPATMLTLQVGPRLSSRGTLEPEIVASLASRVVRSIGYSVDIWRGESIILGVAGPVEVFSTTGRLIWPIRRTFEIGVHGGLFNSTTLSQSEARVYHAEAVAAWSPMGPLIVNVTYGADFQRGDVRSTLLSDRKVVRHLFQVRLTVAPHLSRSFKPEDPLQPLGEREPTKGVQR